MIRTTGRTGHSRRATGNQLYGCPGSLRLTAPWFRGFRCRHGYRLTLSRRGPAIRWEREVPATANGPVPPTAPRWPPRRREWRSTGLLCHSGRVGPARCSCRRRRRPRVRDLVDKKNRCNPGADWNRIQDQRRINRGTLQPRGTCHGQNAESNGHGSLTEAQRTEFDGTQRVDNAEPDADQAECDDGRSAFRRKVPGRRATRAAINVMPSRAMRRGDRMPLWMNREPPV